MIEQMESYRRDKKRKGRKQQRTVWLNKMQRFAIRNLMRYIVFGMGGVYLLDIFISPALGYSLSHLLDYNLDAVLAGQVWRLITFIICPPNMNILFLAFFLYFYWLVGTHMESHWGAAKFNLFYFCGMFATMLAGVITGYATNYYVNLSIFLAFAITYPNFEFMLFLILPVKAKWLALIDGLLYLYALIYNNWPGRLALLLSLLNIIIFLADDIIQIINTVRRKKQRKLKRNTSL